MNEQLENVAEALRKRGFKAVCCATGAEARDYVMKEAETARSVGFGGSMTLRELGLYDTLPTHNEVWSHWAPPEGVAPEEARARAAEAEVYLTSVNALAETGEIVNIDGTGNRVASTLFGHKKVYFVVGRNKLAPDADAAMDRARNVAAPKNARRLGLKTPCAEKGDRCYDCKSPARICRAASVFWTRPGGSDYEVVLIDEDLGY